MFVFLLRFPSLRVSSTTSNDVSNCVRVHVCERKLVWPMCVGVRFSKNSLHFRNAVCAIAWLGFSIATQNRHAHRRTFHRCMRIVE